MILITKQKIDVIDPQAIVNISLTSPLFLIGDPTQSLEAATKRYVDNSKLALNANNVSEGILPDSSFPQLAGDINNSAGNVSFFLSNSGVVAGTYPKVSVDDKGRVIEGLLLTETDIPSLPWSKITSGKPTTAAGYGITDALLVSGGTMTGPISVPALPTTSTQLSNKDYADSVTAKAGILNIGDIVSSSDKVTPVGFLRCNGALLDKTTYAALYSVIGDRYTPPAVIGVGAGKPWSQQYDINTTGVLGTWTTGVSLPLGVYGSHVVVTKNRVYLIGGWSGSNSISTVYTAPINADGTLGTWTTGTSLPEVRHSAACIVTKNRVYLIGGSDGIYPIATVLTAPINADGTLGTWTSSSSLPIALRRSQVIVTKNRVYLLGGSDGNGPVATVYTAIINPDGTLGVWTTGTSLPDKLRRAQVIITKNRAYLLGGFNLAGFGTLYSSVHTAIINPDGTLGTWVAGTPLPGAFAAAEAIVTKDRVYLVGGDVGTTPVTTVYMAPINADGTLGTWTTSSSLPAGLSSSQVIVTNSRAYLLGGWNGTADSPVVYTATMTGGLNDYSSYYNGSFIGVMGAAFGLPNPYAVNTNLNYYIKY